MIIREAGPADLDALLALQREDVIREVHEDDVPVSAYRAAFAEITADPHQQLLVGELDGEVVATAQVTWVRRLTYVGGEMGIVESVRVRSDRRGRRLGEQLMRHVLDLARERGAARVELTTNAQRDGARRFYERLGFVASHVGLKHLLVEAPAPATARPARVGPVAIHHVQVSCPPGGEDAARRFYADGLGLPEVEKPPVLAARGGCWFRAAQPGGAAVEVHVGAEQGFVPARKAHPAFLVGDLDATAVRLEELGFAVDRAEEHTFPGHRRLHTADGNGNRVELLADP